MIRYVQNSQDPAWPKLLAYFKSEFPPETREPDEELIAEVDDKSRLDTRYLIWEEAGEFAGFVRFAVLQETKAKFIYHIAVVPSFRRRAIGLELLLAVLGQYIELPTLAEVDPEGLDGFWQNADVLSASYTQPALRPDTPPMPFHLIVLGQVFCRREAIASFYREVWQLPADHPFVVKAVKG